MHYHTLTQKNNSAITLYIYLFHRLRTHNFWNHIKSHHSQIKRLPFGSRKIRKSTKTSYACVRTSSLLLLAVAACGFGKTASYKPLKSVIVMNAHSTSPISVTAVFKIRRKNPSSLYSQFSVCECMFVFSLHGVFLLFFSPVCFAFYTYLYMYVFLYGVGCEK